MIKNADLLALFAGAGILVDSCMPPFRGENALLNKINTCYFEIELFNKKPHSLVFHENLMRAKQNAEHKILSHMCEQEFIHSVITLSIDHLCKLAVSKRIREHFRTYKQLVCMNCDVEIS